MFTSLVIEPEKFGGDYSVEFNYWGEKDRIYFTYNKYHLDTFTSSITLGDLFNWLANKRNYEAALEEAMKHIALLNTERDSLKKENELQKKELDQAKASLNAIKKTIIILAPPNEHIVYAVSKLTLEN